MVFYFINLFEKKANDDHFRNIFSDKNVLYLLKTKIGDRSVLEGFLFMAIGHEKYNELIDILKSCPEMSNEKFDKNHIPPSFLLRIE